MNTIHNNGNGQPPLEDGLKEVSGAYKKLHEDEPPELLDMAILNSAHRAVERKPRWMKIGWLQGLTTAAVFVLAFSILLDQRESAPGPEDAVKFDRAAEPSRDAVSESEADLPAGETPKEAFQSTSPAPVMAQKKRSPVRQQTAEPQRTGYAQEEQKAKAATEMKDEDIPVLDELRLERRELEAASRETLASEPASIAAGATTSNQPLTADPARIMAPDEKLANIVRLKEDGDERWKTELQSFMNDHPDYPLPDDLRLP